jgi:hypothetical protein
MVMDHGLTHQHVGGAPRLGGQPVEDFPGPSLGGHDAEQGHQAYRGKR